MTPSQKAVELSDFPYQELRTAAYLRDVKDKALELLESPKKRLIRDSLEADDE